MNMTVKNFDLQLFAEDAVPVSESVDVSEAQATDSSDVQAGEAVSAKLQEAGTNASDTDTNTRLPFSEIRKLYKEDFKEYRKGIIEKRFREESGARRDLEALAPIIERAAQKYGLDPGNIKGIAEAVAADKSYYAELAEKNGTTPEIEERLDVSQREAAMAKAEIARRDEEKRREEMLTRINDQVRETQAVYPDFDLDAEMANEEFAEYVTKYPDIPIKRAYELVHMDRIVGNAMQATAATVQMKTVNSIKSGSHRPAENAAGGGAPAKTTRNIAEMSLDELDALFARAERGERGVKP